jgi:hypothetical protein
MFAKLSVLLLLVPFISASPTPEVEERATIDTSTHCGMSANGPFRCVLDLFRAKDNGILSLPADTPCSSTSGVCPEPPPVLTARRSRL